MNRYKSLAIGGLMFVLIGVACNTGGGPETGDVERPNPRIDQPTVTVTAQPTTEQPAASPAAVDASATRAPSVDRTALPQATLEPTAETTSTPATPSQVAPPAPVAEPPTAGPTIQATDTGQGGGGSQLSGPTGCTDAVVTLPSPPMDVNEVSLIVPMGRMQSSHVTPTDHTYFRLNKTAEFEAQAQAFDDGGPVLPWDPQLNVFSPADGLLTEIGTFPFSTARGYSGEVGDYRLIIWHSCTLFSIFIHLSELSQDILDITGEIKSGDNWFPNRSGQPIHLEAGQVIGKVGYHGFDYSLHDSQVMLPGFVLPEHYDGEYWKVHTVDPFDYFAGPVARQLLDKVPRTVEPRGGKIDYDIDGRLAGNWFLDGTVDYSGRVDRAACEDFLCNYWSGHLSIAYDHIDPSQVTISIGRDTGIDTDLCRVCLGVYAVKSGSPDPAEVSVATGLVKYELVARDHTDRDVDRERTTALDDQPLGVLLVQLVDDRTINMEVLPGAGPNQVSGFSDAALIYRR